MNPWAMGLLLAGFWGAFAVTAGRRLRLLRRGAATAESRTSDLVARLGAVWTYGLYQKKMRKYLVAGLAHQLIFLGFAVLLFRTLILWGRGLFDPGFHLFIFGDEPVLGLPVGHVYRFLKDVFAVLVLLGALVFVYYRVIRPAKRMTLGWEGLLILGIIIMMMLGDLSYDGAGLALAERLPAACPPDFEDEWCARAKTLARGFARPEARGFHVFPDPGGSLVAALVEDLSVPGLVVLGNLGFWSHSTLVLVFLNLLPRSKHFHVITAIPNVFFGDRTKAGRLRPLAPTTESLMELVEKASEHEDPHQARIGYARIEHLTWKDYLDLYTCTECGRCSDNCPAFLTGKLLSPKQFTLDLRNHLYAEEQARLELASENGKDVKEPAPKNLVPEIIKPEVLWACTTCRACEEECPVNITYVDKIVQMRRHLVVMQGQFPQELAKPFEGMEVNGNPWNLSAMDRAAWTAGLAVPRIADKPDAEVLYWVGCAASYDDRAKKIARATAELLIQAGVDFAILADQERCTGDPARRAGNEYLFATLAEANAATLNEYKAKGLKRIITTCPHCFNTLANEYPDFGAHFEVVHHTDFVLELLMQGKLVPREPVRARVAYHDSCYLGRYNGIYEPPREILSRIPGVELVEVERAQRERGLCCGAGGAQMWMEEQNKNRVNVKRTRQLLETGAETLASACPFCMTMLSDGVKAETKEGSVKTLDVVELLSLSCRPEGTSAESGLS